MNTTAPPARLAIASAWAGDSARAIGLIERAAAQDLDTILLTGEEATTDGLHASELIDAITAATGARVLFLDASTDEVASLAKRRALEPAALVLIRNQLLWVPRGHIWQWQGRTFASLTTKDTAAFHAASSVGMPLDVLITQLPPEHPAVASLTHLTRPRVHIHTDAASRMTVQTHPNSGDVTTVVPLAALASGSVVLDPATLTVEPVPL